LFVGATECEDGWVPYKDEKCIKLFSSENLLTFEAAQVLCSTQGSTKYPATLVMVKSAEIQAILEEITSNTFDSLWLGATYDTGSKEFKWIDGESLTYSNWQDGYPTNSSDTQNCIELRPTEGRRLTAAKGRWANVPCQKRNLVICQKAPTWSLEDAVEEILSLRRQHQDDVDALNAELVKAAGQIQSLREEITVVNSRVVPVGSIYIEYADQPDPRSLWPTLSWQDISSTYAGLFFRTAGGDASSFGATQDACAPRLSQLYYAATDTDTYPTEVEVPDIRHMCILVLVRTETLDCGLA